MRSQLISNETLSNEIIDLVTLTVTFILKQANLDFVVIGGIHVSHASEMEIRGVKFWPIWCKKL